MMLEGDSQQQVALRKGFGHLKDLSFTRRVTNRRHPDAVSEPKANHRKIMILDKAASSIVHFTGKEDPAPSLFAYLKK